MSVSSKSYFLKASWKLNQKKILKLNQLARVRHLVLDYVLIFKEPISSTATLKVQDRVLLARQVHVSFNSIGNSRIWTDKLPWTRDVCVMYNSTDTCEV